MTLLTKVQTARTFWIFKIRTRRGLHSMFALQTLTNSVFVFCIKKCNKMYTLRWNKSFLIFLFLLIYKHSPSETLHDRNIFWPWSIPLRRYVIGIYYVYLHVEWWSKSTKKNKLKNVRSALWYFVEMKNNNHISEYFW